MQKFTELTKCRVCSSTNLREVLDLNEQPLANNYHEGTTQDVFPLKINTCLDCFHTQLSVVVNPDLMFRDYLYVSGTSKTLHQYFEDFVDLCESYGMSKGKVMDVACNDGTQLDKFKQRGWDTFGVDPAENLLEASSKSHNVKCEYWNEVVALSFGEKFDAITAQNVFAHVADVHSFLKACHVSLSDEGLVFIQTSQADMIIDGQFDTIYHEHLSFFSSKSMKTCANLCGFSLIDVQRVEVHGGSYVFVLKKGPHDESKSTKEVEKEAQNGVYNELTYEKYANGCLKVVNDFKKQVETMKNSGLKVVGYGAAAKGNTFLNFANITLDYIIDDNPLKQGLLTPGMDIPIYDSSILMSEDPDKLVVVPLAWNFFDEIRQRANSVAGSELTFIKYFPNLEVVK